MRCPDGTAKMWGVSDPLRGFYFWGLKGVLSSGNAHVGLARGTKGLF